MTFYNDGTVTIHHGEALDVLRTMPDASVDHIVTDPPYSSGGQFRGDRMAVTSVKYQQSDAIGRLDEFTGDNRDQRGYQYWCALWLDQCRRIAVPGAICALFTDWRQLPTTTDALQSGGWIWRGIAVWGKPSSRPQSGRFASSCEYIVWGTNGPREIEGAAPAGLILQAAPVNRVHMTQKPVEVMRWLLSVARPGDVVLDPFMGTGTTLQAAKDLGCGAVGIEANRGWCEYARDRVAQGVLPLYVPSWQDTDEAAT